MDLARRFGLSGTLSLVALSEPKFGPFGTKVWPFRNPCTTLGYIEKAFAESVTLLRR